MKRTFVFLSIILTIVLNRSNAQDTLYIYQMGSMIYKRAILETDSIIFYKPSLSTCGESFTDVRDNNTYTTVMIGNQCWMKENLRYLPSVSAPYTGSNTQPHYYVYGYQGSDVNTAKSSTYYQTYGTLYNWSAAMNGAYSSNSNPSGVQGICPTGWHLPSDAEFKELEIYLGMTQNEANGTQWRGTNQGSKLAGNNDLWNSGILEGNSDFNQSNFLAIPAGYRVKDGYFWDIANCVYFWSTSEENSTFSWYRSLSFVKTSIYRVNFDKEHGFSVRCIMD